MSEKTPPLTEAETEVLYGLQEAKKRAKKAETELAEARKGGSFPPWSGAYAAPEMVQEYDCPGEPNTLDALVRKVIEDRDRLKAELADALKERDEQGSLKAKVFAKVEGLENEIIKLNADLVKIRGESESHLEAFRIAEEDRMEVEKACRAAERTCGQFREAVKEMAKTLKSFSSYADGQVGTDSGIVLEKHRVAIEKANKGGGNHEKTI